MMVSVTMVVMNITEILYSSIVKSLTMTMVIVMLWRCHTTHLSHCQRYHIGGRHPCEPCSEIAETLADEGLTVDERVKVWD